MFKLILMIIQLLSNSVKYGGQGISILIGLHSNWFDVWVHIHDLGFQFLLQLLRSLEIVEEDTFLNFSCFFYWGNFMILMTIVEDAVNAK